MIFLQRPGAWTNHHQDQTDKCDAPHALHPGLMLAIIWTGCDSSGHLECFFLGAVKGLHTKIIVLFFLWKCNFSPQLNCEWLIQKRCIFSFCSFHWHIGTHMLKILASCSYFAQADRVDLSKRSLEILGSQFLDFSSNHHTAGNFNIKRCCVGAL